MSERDIVEALRPRLTRKALETVADIIESDEALGDGKDAAALRVILAAYVAAPQAIEEILRLRTALAARDAQIAALLKVKEAAEATCVMPDGYCCCSYDRMGSKAVHQPECRDFRAALTTYSEWEKTNADK